MPCGDQSRIARGYVLDTLSRFFLGAAAVLYSVMFIIQVVRFGRVISPRDLDIFLLAFIPLAVVVIPMSLIFSILMTLERLSVESEIIAMQACGVPRASIFAPVMLLSTLCLFLHLSIATYMGPLAMQKIQGRLIQRAPEKVAAFLEEREFIDIFKGMVVYIESVNRKKSKLSDIFIEVKGHDKAVISAETERLEVNPSGVILKLESGSVFLETNRALRYITFDEYRFPIQTDFAQGLKIHKLDVLTQGQLRELIRHEREPKYIKEYYNRFAFPFLNLILGVMGFQFGMQKPRSPRNTGFAIGVATIVGYYLIFLLADRMVKAEEVSPALGAWAPVLVFSLLIASLGLGGKFPLRRLIR